MHANPPCITLSSISTHVRPCSLQFSVPPPPKSSHLTTAIHQFLPLARHRSTRGADKRKAEPFAEQGKLEVTIAIAMPQSHWVSGQSDGQGLAYALGIMRAPWPGGLEPD